VLGTSAAGASVRDADVSGPIAWVFGSEAHGLPAAALAAADAAVAVPIRGRAESLNLATAAAVCLYAGVLRGASD
jgi:TrmH family RNA methyltransferase